MKRFIAGFFVFFVSAIVCIFTYEYVSGSSFSEDVRVFYDEYFVKPVFPEKLLDEGDYNRIYFNALGETEKQAYISLYNNLRTHPKKIDIPFLEKGEMDDVFSALKYDNPELLCIEEGGFIESGKKRCYFLPKYTGDASSCEQKREELRKKADDIIAGMDKNLSDYQKEKYIHDYIVKNCEYADSANQHTPYGVLFDGKATCAGYARAVLLLLTKAGVRNSLVLGQANNASGVMIGHAWNIVYLDGEPYHLDATWDDPVRSVTEKADVISYNYFNITDEAIGRTHQEMSFETNCKAEKFNYFAQEGLLFEKYDSKCKTRLKDAIVKKLGDGEFTCPMRFTSQSEYEKAYTQLFERNEIDSILDNAARQAKVSLNNSYSYSKNDDVFVILVTLN